jgi:hypothetical protein
MGEEEEKECKMCEVGQYMCVPLLSVKLFISYIVKKQENWIWNKDGGHIP